MRQTSLSLSETDCPSFTGRHPPQGRGYRAHQLQVVHRDVQHAEADPRGHLQAARQGRQEDDDQDPAQEGRPQDGRVRRKVRPLLRAVLAAQDENVPGKTVECTVESA